jgi:hypothetical protein
MIEVGHRFQREREWKGKGNCSDQSAGGNIISVFDSLLFAPFFKAVFFVHWRARHCIAGLNALACVQEREVRCYTTRARGLSTTMDPSDSHARTVNDWVMGKHLGSGSFAVVWKATNRVTGQDAAIKEIQLSKLNQKLTAQARNEVATLRGIDHPNIVKLLEVVEVRNHCLQRPLEMAW